MQKELLMSKSGLSLPIVMLKLARENAM